jgi:serine/threonine-protein phosphatase 6 regulatory ankyrin repeat subunit B
MKTLLLVIVMLVALAWSSLAFCGEIHDAAKSDDLEKVKALLKANPDLVSSKESHGWTPLHYAAANGEKDVVELLLANKAEVNATNNNGWTPLHMAILNKYQDIADLLRQHGGQDASPIATPGDSTKIEPKNNRGFQSDMSSIKNDGGLFTLNAALEDTNTIKTQLRDHPDWIFDKDANGENPLLISVLAGRKDVVELLLTYKIDVNSKDNAGQTALHKAAYSNQKDIAELLLANRANVNAKDINGDTPLHFAANSGCEDVAEVLLANKANVNAKDNSGMTPLHMAAWGHEGVAESKFVNVAKLLLANKANANAKNNGGGTPLFYAAFMSDNKDMVELLLAHKAEVNAKSNQGVTVLYLLTHYSHETVNPETGKTERDDRNFQDVVDLLRQHGGHE